MDLASYWRIVRKNWWLILICAVLGMGAGAMLNYRTTPQYASTVTFYVSTPTDAAGGNAYQANQYALAKIESYVGLLTSDRLATMVVDKGGIDLTPDQVSKEITAQSDLNTVLLTATVIDESPSRSLAIATAISTEFGTYIDQLDNRTTKEGAQGSTVKLNVVDGPTLKADPVSPRIRTNLALGLGAGLAIGVLLALLRGLADTTVRSIDQLRSITGLPALGAITNDATVKRTPVLTADQMRSIRAEGYRQIRTNLQFMDIDNPVQVLVVTSSMSGEGKSTTAANLALVSAESGRKVVLIEADLRRPRISEYLGLEGAVGLTNVLAGQVKVSEVLQPYGADGLTVLPAGSTPPNPSELLGSHNMVDLLDELRASFDLIILDTPPLLPVTDAAVAAVNADGVVVVVRYGKTTKTQITAALHSLDAVDARILGCVLSMVPSKGGEEYGRYGYYEAETGRRSRRERNGTAKPVNPELDSQAGVADAAIVTGAQQRRAGSYRPDPDQDRDDSSDQVPDGIVEDVVDDGVVGDTVDGSARVRD